MLSFIYRYPQKRNTVNPYVPCVRCKANLNAHAQDLNFVDGGISFVNSEVEFL